MIDRSCIYAITNLVNGNRYIGSAIDFAKRRREHRHDLRHGKHRNAHLQRAWDKHGEGNFGFVILSKVDANDLIRAEQIWLDEYNPEYNLAKMAGSTKGIKLTPEMRKNLSDRSQGNTYRKGASHTLESRLLMSKSHTGMISPLRGIPRSQAVKDKLRSANVGKKQSSSTKAKMREAQKIRREKEALK